VKTSDEAFQEMKQKLQGSDPEFDRKIRDLLAEIHAYSYLKRSGFSNISLIPLQGIQKTPDFSAEKGGCHYIIEAKNLRAPTSVLNIIFNKLDELVMRAPELYEKYKYHIEVTVELPGEQFDDTDETAITVWLTQLEAAVCHNASTVVTHTWSKNISTGMPRGKKIECHLSRASHYDIEGVYCVASGCDPRIILLSKLKDKLELKVCEAKNQLLEFCRNPSVLKLILLNWQKPSWGEGFDQEVREGLISTLNARLKELDSTLKAIVLPD